MRKIAVVGHPGSGKSTLLAQLQGAEGGTQFQWEEMPGIHMLGRNTPGEKRVYDALLGWGMEEGSDLPAGIVAIAEAGQLERQLYLISQLIDLRLPVVVGITKLEKAAREGIEVDVNRLGEALGVPLVRVTTSEQDHIGRMLDALGKLAGYKKIERAPHWRPSVALAEAFHHFDRNWGFEHLTIHKGARFIEGLRLLTVPKAVEDYQRHTAYEDLEEVLKAARRVLEDSNERWTTVEVVQRHNGLGQILQTTVRKSSSVAPAKSGTWWGGLFGNS